ncbi:nad dependent epimerase/dehydratase family protein [Heliomicrobium modesticaldum Ice1]|uniref:Nad dependent epimerase/dehydratase family protein n=1 Tax=Heliobacterium modesticaldum (strain ATCC 51547 / Ice1) TaxID=498761 RepID=B0TBN9_HELMI|nr:TIGR01777 family oxidoreductase [Heliomicrobium modesticaldum]ABZ83878.1 nad dependent epimerase/dehydratase family protein [Heliomicrobium modesticaldum Ice1]
MNVLVTGGTGFVGGALVEHLVRKGHQVSLLSRRKGKDRRIGWFLLQDGRFPAESLDGVEIVINLAGENIGASRWTKATKSRILDSRVSLTGQIVSACQRRREQGDKLPRLLINASAVGYYGTSEETIFTEEDGPGSGFLAEVCRRWEAAAEEASPLGIRLIRLRLGVVFGPGGGMLAKMDKPFRYGLGGVVGTGRQWISWVHRDDVLGVIDQAIGDASMNGAYNLCSPNPVTMAELCHALARRLGGRAWATVPAYALRLAFGEMADEMLLSGQRVLPKRLSEAGYPFRHSRLEEALAAIYR